jgi:RimJ/RimL family protein N-acetyltransferase
MKLETERLILREITMDDFEKWYEILSDDETMKHYPSPFDAEKVKKWITWNINNYATYGYGLWAVILKETGEFIGDCGMTMQNIHGEMLPEIGYHIHKKHQKKGYASEAAKKCMEFAFEDLKLPKVYSYMKYTNEASYGVAIKNGMKLVEEYENPVNTITKVYAMTCEEWKVVSRSEKQES